MPTLTLNLENTADNPAFEVECATCKYWEDEVINNPDALPENIRAHTEANAKCMHCNGKGTRRVRLVGAVEVEVFGPFHAVGDKRGELDEHYLDEFVKKIVEAWQAGTLPESIREQLHEEPVDD